MENKSCPSSGSNDINSFAASERKRKSRTSDASDVARIPSSLKQRSTFQQKSGRGNACDLSASENSPMSEKLWDGSLQLNSSITVSAVAFFKSGERLLDMSWSKSVEVKGKVRLDAFEKYIQDLPRSRTRGLMIISLCAKEESSEKGLKGLIEVSKAYIKGERVGIAQLSPGVDVYLCPRCDKIFRILAKYGSFEGMGATEDKLESLIGCVVWRKNQTAASSVVKEKDSKGSLPKQPQKSPSDSSTQNAGGGERGMSSSSMPMQDSISSSVRPSSGVQSMNISAKEVEIGNSAATTMQATPVPTKSIIAIEQQESGHFNLSSQTTSKRYHFGSEAASIHNSVPEKTKASLELPNKFISVPSDMVKQKISADEDDDLPEYDYGTSCGTSFTSAGMPLGVSRADSRLETERTMNVGHMLSSLPVRHSSSASNQGMPLSKVTANHDPRFHGTGRLEDKCDFQKYATPAAFGAPPFALSVIPSDELQKRNLFSNNDDDMPEWLPPRQQRLLFPSPTHSQFPPGFPQTYQQPRKCRLPPSLPIRNSLSFLTGFGYNGGLRPPSGYPFQPADERDWRP